MTTQCWSFYESHAHCRWKQRRATVHYLKSKASIVVAWLLAVCFSGSLIRRRRRKKKTEWGPWSVCDLHSWAEWSDSHYYSENYYSPPVRPPSSSGQDYYFWQCLHQEGTFADLMGPGPLYTDFCMACCHHFHREKREMTRELRLK